MQTLKITTYLPFTCNSELVMPRTQFLSNVKHIQILIKFALFMHSKESLMKSIGSYKYISIYIHISCILEQIGIDEISKLKMIKLAKIFAQVLALKGSESVLSPVSRLRK